MIREVSKAVNYYHWCIPFSVDGNPPPSIRWQFDNEDLPKTKYIYTTFFPEGAQTSTTIHGCLNLNKPTHFSNGNYTLLVANALGTASCTTYQHFMDIPDETFQEEEPFHGTGLRCPRPLLRPSEAGCEGLGSLVWWGERRRHRALPSQRRTFPANALSPPTKTWALPEVAEILRVGYELGREEAPC